MQWIYKKSGIRKRAQYPEGAGFKKGGFRRRIGAAALLFAFLLALTGCQKGQVSSDPYTDYVDKPVKALSSLLFKGPALDKEELGEPAEGKSALTMYNSFQRSLKSGEVKKTRYSTKSLYEVVSYSTEEIVFTTREDGNLVMTYRQRQPLVFWYHPEADYYDGECYYYKHNGDWFVDTYDRHANQVELGAMGIPAESIDLYRIMENEVLTRPDGGYQVYVRAENRADRENIAQVVGVADKEGMFSYIEVTLSYPDSAAGSKDIQEKEMITEKYIIEYSRINEVVKVEPPQSLTQEEMEYLQQEYRNAKKQRE